jgi:hypothetical protein
MATCGNQFYLSVENMFEKALKELEALGLEINPLRERLAKVFISTSGIGWGDHHTPCDLYYESFGEWS